MPLVCGAGVAGVPGLCRPGRGHPRGPPRDEGDGTMEGGRVNSQQLPDMLAALKARLEAPAPLRSRVLAELIGRQALRQLTEPERELKPRLPTISDLGKCARALAFKRAGAPPRGHVGDWRARLTWMTGDAVEATLLTALAESLDGTGYHLAALGTEDRQENVTLAVRGEAIRGHPDAVLLDDDGIAVVSVGCKSANPYAFDLWAGAVEEGREPWGPDESYYWQAQGYIYALTLPAEYEIVEDKSSGAVIGWFHRRDPNYVLRLAAHLAHSRGDPSAAPRTLPDGRELVPAVDLHKTLGTPNKGHGLLPWQCCYCPYWRTCWPAAVETVTWYPRPKRALQIPNFEEAKTND